MQVAESVSALQTFIRNFRQAQLQVQRRQRRAQFVGGIGDKIPLHSDGGGDFLQQSIERADNRWHGRRQTIDPQSRRREQQQGRRSAQRHVESSPLAHGARLRPLHRIPRDHFRIGPPAPAPVLYRDTASWLRQRQANVKPRPFVKISTSEDMQYRRSFEPAFSTRTNSTLELRQSATESKPACVHGLLHYL